jgi:hypothetical protein
MSKLDKDTFIKYRFWFLIPVVVLLWACAFIPLFSMIAESNTNMKAALDKKKLLEDIPRQAATLRNQRIVDDAVRETKLAEGLKYQLWYNDYDLQNGIYRPRDQELLLTLRLLHDTLQQRAPADKSSAAAGDQTQAAADASLPPFAVWVDEQRVFSPVTVHEVNELLTRIRAYRIPIVIESFRTLEPAPMDEEFKKLREEELKKLPKDKDDEYKRMSKNRKDHFLTTGQTDFLAARAKERFPVAAQGQGVYLFLFDKPSFGQVEINADLLAKFPQLGKLKDRVKEIMKEDRFRNLKRLIDWPEELARRGRKAELEELRASDFGEPVKVPDSEYAGGSKPLYADRYLTLYKKIDRSGPPLVDFQILSADPASRDREKRAEFVIKPLPKPAQPIPFYEAWTIEEDIAVKTEMMNIFVDAIDSVALLQSDWREIPPPMPTEVKKEAPPAPAPPAPVTPAPAPAPADPNAPQTTAVGVPATKGPPPPPVPITASSERHKAFLNSTWQIKDQARPDLDWMEGWVVDLELVEKENDVLLKGTVYNLSRKEKLPPVKIRVYVNDGWNPKAPDAWRHEDFVELAAGDLPASDPAQYDPKTAGKGKLADASKRSLRDDKNSEEIKLPLIGQDPPIGQGKEKARRIIRVETVPAAGLKDQRRFANPYWLVDVGLVPAVDANSSHMLKGTVFNQTKRPLLFPVVFEVKTRDKQGQETTTAISYETGETIYVGQHRTFEVAIKSAQGVPEKIVEVRQVLDRRTVPIKSILDLRVGTPDALADRFRGQELKYYDFLRKDIKVPHQSRPVAAPVPAGDPNQPAPAPAPEAAPGQAAAPRPAAPAP